MKNALPVVINSLIVICLFYIKSSYGEIHWLISDLYKQTGGGNETITSVIRANDSTILPTIVIAVGCLITSIVLVRNEQIDKTLSVVSLLFCLGGVGYAVAAI